MTRSTNAMGGIVLAALAAAGLVFAAEVAAKGSQETIQANVLNMGSGPKTGALTIWIDSYTSDEDALRYVEAFNAGGQDAVVELWQKEKPVVGRLRFAQTLAYDLRVARSIPTDTGRRIRLATDRPIQGFEVMRGLRSEDYPIAWIEIELDAEGKGEGQMIAAAALEAKDGALIIKSYGTQAMKIVNARLKVK